VIGDSHVGTTVLSELIIIIIIIKIIIINYVKQCCQHSEIERETK
jgi:hypothetical protein